MSIISVLSVVVYCADAKLPKTEPCDSSFRSICLFFWIHKNFNIKTMNRKEVDIAIEWAANEGWNPGKHDADCFHSADPEGFLIGLLGDEPKEQPNIPLDRIFSVTSFGLKQFGHTFDEFTLPLSDE